MGASLSPLRDARNSILCPINRLATDTFIPLMPRNRGIASGLTHTCTHRSGRKHCTCITSSIGAGTNACRANVSIVSEYRTRDGCKREYLWNSRNNGSASRMGSSPEGDDNAILAKSARLTVATASRVIRCSAISGPLREDQVVPVRGFNAGVELLVQPIGTIRAVLGKDRQLIGPSDIGEIGLPIRVRLHHHPQHKMAHLIQRHTKLLRAGR